jgi:hypothetical protein
MWGSVDSGFTGNQTHDVLRVLRALRVKIFFISAAPRQIKSVLRTLRVRLESVLRMIFTQPAANGNFYPHD